MPVTLYILIIDQQYREECKHPKHLFTPTVMLFIGRGERVGCRVYPTNIQEDLFFSGGGECFGRGPAS